MKYRVLKTFLHDRLGKCVKGSIVELASLSGVARFVELVEDSPAPLSDAAASPAAPASPQQTSKPSKRGRKPKAES